MHFTFSSALACKPRSGPGSAADAGWPVTQGMPAVNWHGQWLGAINWSEDEGAQL